MAMDLELPPDVLSSDDDQMSAAESPVELPGSILGQSQSCCKKNCLQQLGAGAKLEQERLKSNLEPLDLEGKNMIWFNQLLNMNRKQPEGRFRTTFIWQDHGGLCLKAYSEITGCPEKKVRQMLKAISEGEVLPPQDARKNPLRRPEPKREDVESFFCFLYQHLAEPLAIVEEDDRAGHVELPDWVHDDHDLLQWTSQACPGDGSRPKIVKRWLPTMSSAELSDLYRDMHQQHESVASQATFSRVWRQWQGVLGIRTATQHSRCDDCAKYSPWSK